MALKRNTAGQKVVVQALDVTGPPVTGDAANLTCKVSKDHGTATALADTNPTEAEGGVYRFDLAKSETNAGHLLFFPESSTADTYVVVLDGSNGRTEAAPETVEYETPGPLATTKRVAALARVTNGSKTQDVDFALTGQNTKTVTVDDDYDNDDTSGTTGVSTFFDVPVDTDLSTLTLTVTPSSGSTAVVQASVLVDADPQFGCAPRFMDAVHCRPTSCLWNGKLASIVSEAGRARRHLSVGGQPWGEVFADVPESDRQVADRYHNGSAIAVAGDRLVLAMTDHNSRLYITSGRHRSELTTRPSYALTGASESSTYIDLVALPDGTVYVQTRNINELHLYEITNLESQTPTVVKMVLYNGSSGNVLPYPRGLTVAQRDDGAPLILGSVQLRTEPRWLDLGVYVFDPATRLIYNSRGETNSNTANGTTASPKVAASLWEESDYTVTNVPTIVGQNGLTNTRYQMHPALKVREWNASTKQIWSLLVFADIESGTADAASPPEFRLLSYDGVDRIVTASGGDPFGLDGVPSFRFSGFVHWSDPNTNSTTAELWIGVLENAFDADDEYNQFGTDTRFRRVVIDVDGISDAASLLAGTTVREDVAVATDWAAEIRSVEGSDGVVICEAIEGTHLAEVIGAARWRRLGVPGQGLAALDYVEAPTAAANATAVWSADTRTITSGGLTKQDLIDAFTQDDGDSASTWDGNSIGRQIYNPAVAASGDAAINKGLLQDGTFGLEATKTAVDGVSGGLIAPVSVRPLGPHDRLRLASRAGGYDIAPRTLRGRPGEKKTYFLELGGEAAAGDGVDAFARPASSDETVAVALDNPADEAGRYWAVREGGVAFTVQWDAAAATGDACTLTLDLTVHDGKRLLPTVGVVTL